MSADHAQKYAEYLLGGNTSLTFVEAPVVHQDPSSNDCGMFPAFFLGIFLQDINHYSSKIKEVRFVIEIVYPVSYFTVCRKRIYGKLSGNKKAVAEWQLWQLEKGGASHI